MKILKIGAVWCNGCLVMRPRMAAIEKENPWLETVYYEFDEHPEICKQYAVESGVLPVLIFLNKQGKEIDRVSGEVPQKQLMELINQYKDA